MERYIDPHRKRRTLNGKDSKNVDFNFIFFIQNYRAYRSPSAGEDHGRSIQIGVWYVPLQQHYL